jgi:hypothetical protein
VKVRCNNRCSQTIIKHTGFWRHLRQPPRGQISAHSTGAACLFSVSLCQAVNTIASSNGFKYWFIHSCRNLLISCPTGAAAKPHSASARNGRCATAGTDPIPHAVGILLTPSRLINNRTPCTRTVTAQTAEVHGARERTRYRYRQSS